MQVGDKVQVMKGPYGGLRGTVTDTRGIKVHHRGTSIDQRYPNLLYEDLCLANRDCLDCGEYDAYRPMVGNHHGSMHHDGRHSVPFQKAYGDVVYSCSNLSAIP